MSADPSAHDLQMMRLACRHSRLWLGASSPNPAVGAVACDARGNVLAADAHRRAGQPHGEINVLNLCRAHNRLQDIDTLYVNLEPCNHHGRTPPCSEALIAAGIRRLVVAAPDPDPHVAGGGIKKLRQAGIETVLGVGAQEARQAMHSFFYRAQTGGPWITVKRAFTAGGSMLPPTGHKTFTSRSSLRLAHRLRKKCDAILTGSGTILADQPLFTIRHVPDYSGKRRLLAILDRRRRVSPAYIEAAARRGLDALIFDDIDTALTELARRGAQDILVEAGPGLSDSLLKSGRWTMSVAMRQDAPDRVEAAFNSRAALPFDTAFFDWDLFLPEELNDRV